jgi:hydroxymethylbilane synthase
VTFRLGTTPALAPELASVLDGPGDAGILREHASADGLFAALREGELDAVAVPAAALWSAAAEGADVAVVPRRVEPRDVLVPAGGPRLTLDTVRSGGRIGVRSARRLALLAVHRPDVRAFPLANGHTPAALLDSGSVDALILGSAEARRAGLADAATEVIPAKTWLPAPGQGATAILVRPGDAAAAARMSAVDDPPSRAALVAERALADELGVAYDGPLSALALPYGRWLRLWAMVATAEGRRVVRADVSGPQMDAAVLARSVARLLEARGVGALLP